MNKLPPTNLLQCTQQLLQSRMISTSPSLQYLQKMSCVQVVDNSMLGRRVSLAGKKVRIIHVYKKHYPAYGYIGDQVLVSILGQKKKAFIVGCKQKQEPNVARFDTNNVVLLQDDGTPMGTRIRVPIPAQLRGKEGEFTKMLSIATSFV